MKLLALAMLCAAPAAAQSDICDAVDGAVVVTEDGKFLGTLSSHYEGNSIFNKYGSFGSKYSSDSIWNKYGSYGGAYASESPFNKYSSSAPFVVKNRKVIARLSVNKSLSGAINPMILGITCFDYEPDE